MNDRLIVVVKCDEGVCNRIFRIGVSFKFAGKTIPVNCPGCLKQLHAKVPKVPEAEQREVGGSPISGVEEAINKIGERIGETVDSIVTKTGEFILGKDETPK
ncbi:MAG TPA: hypothetical protein VJC12_02400 [Candidatus Paceibacterota bacterium]